MRPGKPYMVIRVTLDRKTMQELETRDVMEHLRTTGMRVDHRHSAIEYAWEFDQHRCVWTQTVHCPIPAHTPDTCLCTTEGA